MIVQINSPSYYSPSHFPGNWLYNFDIRVGMNSGSDVTLNDLCHHQTTEKALGSTTSYTCSGAISGQYVSVNKTATYPLVFCEVESKSNFFFNESIKHSM